MTEQAQQTAPTLSPKDKLKEEILAKHRLMRVLPRTQMELREQEDNLTKISIDASIKHILNELEQAASGEQKDKLKEAMQKYNLSN